MKKPLRIACFGDSLTEGYGLAPDAALPSVLQAMLQAEGIDATCLNFGISGETSEDGLHRIQDVINAKPDAAIVAFGANDCFVGDSPQTVKANLSTIITQFKQHDIAVLLVGIAALTNGDESYRTAFDPIFEELATTYSIPFMPDILASYFHSPSLKLMDEMHPNEQGVERIAQDMIPHVKQLITEIDS